MTTSSLDRRATSSTASPGSAGALPALRAGAVALCCAGLGACGGERAEARPAPAPPGVSAVALSSAIEFEFESLDERRVASATTRGAPTVISFVTTSSLPAQAQVNFLVAMAKHDLDPGGSPQKDRVHYAVVAVEPAQSRELVEMYKKALAIPFPVAMADGATLAGLGAFGDVSAVPVTLVLDREGRIVWRIDGRVAKSAEMRAALEGL